MIDRAFLRHFGSVALCFSIAGCGGGASMGTSSVSTGSTGGAGGSMPAPSIGTVETFADLPASSEGIAFGPGPDGEPVLFVGSGDEILRLDAGGTITEHVNLPSPLGIAVRADGDLLVCGKSESPSDTPGVIYRVTPSGTKSLFVGTDAGMFANTNFVAIAPDDSIAFSDSAADKVYRAAADGSGVALITDTIAFPNGLAFSADGKTLFVASWSGKRVHSIPRAADGTYGPPEVFVDDTENVDGISVFASGALLLVASSEGVIRYGLDKKKTVIAAGSVFGLPANAAFGAGDFGEGWVYVSNILGPRLARVYTGEGGVALPIR